MATPMDTSSELTVQREYPSSAFLNSTAVAVTDGNGLLYILPIRETGDSEPIGTFTLRTGGKLDAPFKLHHIHRVSPTRAVLMLSSRYYPSDGRKPSTSTTESNSSVEFDIWAVKIDLLSLRPGSEPREFDVLWHRRGEDVPMYTYFVEQVNAFLILGGSTYFDPDANVAPVKPYEPSADEIAPIPRPNENLDSTAMITDVSDANKPVKPPPYSWTQTSDAVTVAFPLPSNTPKNKIKVLFTTQTLTLHIDSYPLDDSANDVPLPHYSAKLLWDTINTTSCFWTWDREGERAYGLLTLHMEKRNEGTRWMQVFAASATSVGEDSQDVEVPETVDPSELYLIRESLEKYTAALRTGKDASGLGLGRGLPSLVEGEMDEDADSAVGRRAFVTWVEMEGKTPDWIPKIGKEAGWEEESIKVLSTPMPGSRSGLGDLQLIIKHDVDGPVFSLVPANTPPNLGWKHTSTYYALAFVLASKQDTRFTYHLPNRGVFAFEGGSMRDRGANVYIYRPPAKAKDVSAKQSVLQVDDGSGGALLGVGCVNVKGGRDGEVILVCLTEGELVLIRGV